MLSAYNVIAFDESALTDIDQMNEAKKQIVAECEIGKVMIVTLRVSDSPYQYETLLCDPQYGEEQWITVRNATSEAEAIMNHNELAGLVKESALPDIIVDCGESRAAKESDSIHGPKWREKKRINRSNNS